MAKNNILFIGDVHGKINKLNYILEYYEDEYDYAFILGDVGLGFITIPQFAENVLFIRGNHDDPALCKEHPNYLGDIGYHEPTGIFYISGAWSIDKEYRTPGVSWWPDEELNDEQFEKGLELYRTTRPTTVVSHDCPLMFYSELLQKDKIFSTRTAIWLNKFVGAYQPKNYLFGHHHINIDENYFGMRVICLNELKHKELIIE